MTDSEKLDLILEKVSGLDKRMGNLEKKVNKLEVGQSEIKKELYMLDRRISDTYRLALEAWGQSEENRVLIEEEKAIG